MKIKFNSALEEIQDGASLETLLEQKKLSGKQLSTAVNQEFVPKSERGKYILKNGDSVAIFSIITGG